MDDGTEMDVSDRKYFQDALTGDWTIQRVDEPKNGAGPLFVLAAPMFREGRVAGVLHGSFDVTRLETLIAPEVFGDDAYAIVCAVNGDLLAGTDNPHYILTENNVYVSLKSEEMEDGFTVSRLKEAVLHKESGAFSYRSGAGRRYVVYMPMSIVPAGEKHWVMYSVVTEDVVTAEAARLTRYNLILTGVILLSALAAFLCFRYRDRQANRLLEQERNRLRASEEQNRVAVENSGMLMARYDLKTGTYHNESDILFQLGYGRVIENVPEAFIQGGLVAPECVEEFRALYDNLRKGINSTLFAALRVPEGGFRWFRKDATFVLDESDRPYQAIVIYYDVTEQREKAAVYAKWK